MKLLDSKTRLSFENVVHSAPATSGIDVITTLSNFAIVSYTVDYEALRKHVHERFEIECIDTGQGEPKAIISVVPFLDEDFRFVCCPWPKWKFGQTNYRAYVWDREREEHVVWFFGTALDSIAVNVPHYLWQLPWHRAKIQFKTEFDESAARFSSYEMTAKSAWAPAELSLEDSGSAPQSLAGFADLETGLAILTHPTKGYFYRRDGKLGGYSIWHDQLHPTQGSVKSASFELLDRLDLVPSREVSQIHSVLIQRQTEFKIYLPPQKF